MSNRRERLFSEPKSETVENEIDQLTGEVAEQLPEVDQDNFLKEINAPIPEAEVKGLFFEDYFNEDKWNELEKSSGEELTGEILTHKNMEINKPYNFLWTGYGTIADKVTGEARKAVKLVNKEKQTFYCASLVVCSAFEKMEEKFPTPVRLISLGMKEGKSNNYWNVKVYKL